MDKLSNCVLRGAGRVALQEFKRFAGHSKWQNIKNTKMAKDKQKSMLYSSLTMRMRFAIMEGKSADPNQNLTLKRIIDQATKMHMPASTIKNVLTQYSNRNDQLKDHYLVVQGPAGIMVLIHLQTENIARSKTQFLSPVTKKTPGFKLSDQFWKTFFDHKGVVLTELKGDIDKATEDAIEVSAEDVEEIELDDKKLFQFTCTGDFLPQVTKKLEEMEYSVLSSDNDFIPRIPTDATPELEEALQIYADKLRTSLDVVDVYHNIVKE